MKVFVVLFIVSCFIGFVIADGTAISTAAQSQIKPSNPYSWGGGDNYGPTRGIYQTISPYCNDTRVIGFDCSGLSKYAVYQGTGISLPHQASVQYGDSRGKHVLASVALPGDLLFYSSDGTPSGIYHVTIVIGSGKMAEATSHCLWLCCCLFVCFFQKKISTPTDNNCTGKPPAISTIRTSQLYPNATRFWTATTPTQSSSVFHPQTHSSYHSPKTHSSTGQKHHSNSVWTQSPASSLYNVAVSFAFVFALLATTLF